MAHESGVAPADARPSRRGGERSEGFWGAVALGLCGYLVAVCGFFWFAFYASSADPAEAMAAGLALLVAVAAATTMAVGIAAFLLRRRRPDQTIGLMIGAVAGVLVVVAFLLPAARVVGDLSHQCACVPLLQQLPR